jgi:hypothetical protein
MPKMPQDAHKFDSNLLIVEKIHALENDAKRSLSYLLSHAIVNANNV